MLLLQYIRANKVNEVKIDQDNESTNPSIRAMELIAKWHYFQALHVLSQS